MRTENFEKEGVFQMFLSPTVLKKDNLNSTERLLLIIITALDKGRYGCFLSNAQLGWLAGCSPGTVSTSVKRMLRLKYIVVNKQCPINGGRSYMRKVSDDVKRK